MTHGWGPWPLGQLALPPSPSLDALGCPAPRWCCDARARGATRSREDERGTRSRPRLVARPGRAGPGWNWVRRTGRGLPRACRVCRAVAMLRAAADGNLSRKEEGAGTRARRASAGSCNGRAGSCDGGEGAMRPSSKTPQEDRCERPLAPRVVYQLAINYGNTKNRARQSTPEHAPDCLGRTRRWRIPHFRRPECQTRLLSPNTSARRPQERPRPRTRQTPSARSPPPDFLCPVLVSSSSSTSQRRERAASPAPTTFPTVVTRARLDRKRQSPSPSRPFSFPVLVARPCHRRSNTCSAHSTQAARQPPSHRSFNTPPASPDPSLAAPKPPTPARILRIDRCWFGASALIVLARVPALGGGAPPPLLPRDHPLDPATRSPQHAILTVRRRAVRAGCAAAHRLGRASH